MLRKQVKELNAKTSDAKEAETLSKKVQEQAREIETLNIQVRAKCFKPYATSVNQPISLFR